MNECTLGTWVTQLHTLQKKLSFLYRSWISIKTDNYTRDVLKSFVREVSTESPAVMVSTHVQCTWELLPYRLGG
jgi:hypothetical protein